MKKLDFALLRQVKLGFVPQGGGAEPVQGAGPMTAAMGSPVGGPPGGAPGGDPSQGAPVDPSQGGDPSQQAAPMPPSGLDPAMAGMLGGQPAAPGDPAAGGMSGNSMMSVDDFIKLLKAVKGTISGQAGQPAPAATPQQDPKTDEILRILKSVAPQP